MCRSVYLTCRRFDKIAREFVRDLAKALKEIGIEVHTGVARDVFSVFRFHRTYDVAVGIDFHRDEGSGGSLCLNSLCSPIGREFAYNLSKALDIAMPKTRWRELAYVKSSNKTWAKFFWRVSSQAKCLFYICTASRPVEIEEYYVAKSEIISLFAEQISFMIKSDMCRCEYNKLARRALKKKMSDCKSNIEEDE